MKVVILAGGYGTRLGRITEMIPKPMVQIGKKPILWHIMNYYAKFNFKDFIICLGYKGEIIKDYFYNYQARNSDFTINLKSKDVTFYDNSEQPNWDVTLVDTGISTLKGGRIKKISQFLDDTNLLTYGDGVSDVDIDKLVEFHKSHGKILTITGVRPPSRFGELQLDKNNQIKSFSEKPQISNGMINGGYMVFNKELLEYLDEDGDLEIGPFDILAKKGEIMVYQHPGFWECMDNERDVNHLNSLWESKQAPWKFK